MKSFIISISLLLGVAYAGDRTTAYNMICKPMTFESQRLNCQSRIKDFTFFDTRALKICAHFTFEKDKLSCLDLIGDKSYDIYEIDKCENEAFDVKKLKCLNESGTIYDSTRPSCVPREEAIEQISWSLRYLRSGNSSAADQKLQNLLEKFTNCKPQ
jgi:hypothetical protein